MLPIRKTPEIVSIFPHFQAIYSIFKYFNHIVLFSVLSLYGKFILLKHDFKEIDVTGTLEKQLFQVFKKFIFKFCRKRKKTYQDLYNEVVSIANHLLHLGVKKGDKVAILSANMPNWGITQFAIANIGAIAVPVLPGFCSTELQNILEHAEVKVIFVSRLLAKCLEGVKHHFLEHKIPDQ